MTDIIEPSTAIAPTNTAAPRCPDFDSDCAHVRDHALCAAGNVISRNGEVYEMPPAVGYCPYLCGMVSR